MGKTRIHFNADVAGWQNLCLAMAGTRDSFEVHHLRTLDLPFCRDFCEKYDYQFEFESSGTQGTGIFSPGSTPPPGGRPRAT